MFGSEERAESDYITESRVEYRTSSHKLLDVLLRADVDEKPWRFGVEVFNGGVGDGVEVGDEGDGVADALELLVVGILAAESGSHFNLSMVSIKVFIESIIYLLVRSPSRRSWISFSRLGLSSRQGRDPWSSGRSAYGSLARPKSTAIPRSGPVPVRPTFVPRSHSESSLLS